MSEIAVITGGTSGIGRATALCLRDAGYTSVGYADLIEFVNGDGKLPEKPLLITIDDGYQNNLDLAAPLLEKYGLLV